MFSLKSHYQYDKIDLAFPVYLENLSRQFRENCWNEMRHALFVRADKFLRIFKQNLDLREITGKSAPNSFNFAHENKFDLNFRKLTPVFRV